jgi:ubiquinone/menaquinone biosynthesis C-methylase UbiE
MPARKVLMFSGLYAWLHRITVKPQERGEYSSGIWQDMIRTRALAWCAGLDGRLLEVGCGEGLFLQNLCRQGNPRVEAYGVDMDPQRVEQARKRLAGSQCRVSVEDATSLSAGDNYFAAAVCVNVFFNMPDLSVVTRALAEMKRVCRPGGMLIVDFRNAANPFLRLKYFLAPWYDPTVKGLPLRTYRLQQMRGVLDALGLTVEQVVPIGAKSPRWAPILMLKVKRP